MVTPNCLTEVGSPPHGHPSTISPFLGDHQHLQESGVTDGASMTVGRLSGTDGPRRRQSKTSWSLGIATTACPRAGFHALSQHRWHLVSWLMFVCRRQACEGHPASRSLQTLGTAVGALVLDPACEMMRKSHLLGIGRRDGASRERGVPPYGRHPPRFRLPTTLQMSRGRQPLSRTGSLEECSIVPLHANNRPSALRRQMPQADLPPPSSPSSARIANPAFRIAGTAWYHQLG